MEISLSHILSLVARMVNSLSDSYLFQKLKFDWFLLQRLCCPVLRYGAISSALILTFCHFNLSSSRILKTITRVEVSFGKRPITFVLLLTPYLIRGSFDDITGRDMFPVTLRKAIEGKAFLKVPGQGLSGGGELPSIPGQKLSCFVSGIIKTGRIEYTV